MAITQELARAFGSHTLWKTRIERAADSGKSEFQPEDVCKDSLCTFGKFLHDPKLSADSRASGHFDIVSGLHADFHRAAGQAIGLAVGGDAAAARAELTQGRFFQVSQNFYHALFAWQRDAAIGHRADAGPVLRLMRSLTGHLGVRLWAAIALPAALALASLIFILMNAETLAGAGAALGRFEAGFAVTGLAACLLTMLLVRGITRPLAALTEATRGLAKGDLAATLPSMDRADIVGDLARAILVFQEQALAVERIAGVREREREKNEADRRAALLHMADTIESQTASTIGRIADESERVYQTAKDMAKGAQNVEENAQLVAAAAEQSLVNAETVAAATDKLSASIHQIATQMEKSRLVVSDAVTAAENASTTVDQLSQAMAAIDQVVQLIAEIASQTNLLALNATIEAARAGEAGKGFAVVANEVKNLANQTARQTNEISQRIAHLNDMAGKVIDAIHSTVRRVQDVEVIAEAVAQSVQEQNQATDQISRNVMQSSHVAREVSDRIVTVADEAVNTGRQAGQVETMLRGMTDEVGALGRLLTQLVRGSASEGDRRDAPRDGRKTTAAAGF